MAGHARLNTRLARERKQAASLSATSLSATRSADRALVTEAPQAQAAPSPSSPATLPVLLTPEQAVEHVRASLPLLFEQMVVQGDDLLVALTARNLDQATFFIAMDADSGIRAWYRAVLSAKALKDVEGVKGVLDDMDEKASDEDTGNGVRNAQMAAARLRVEQARWTAQRLLPQLFGEKTTKEMTGKVEIVVRRETKKVVKEA